MRCPACSEQLRVQSTIRPTEHIVVRVRLCDVSRGGCGKRFTAVEVLNSQVPDQNGYGKGGHALAERLLDDEGRRLEAAVQAACLDSSLD